MNRTRQLSIAALATCHLILGQAALAQSRPSHGHPDHDHARDHAPQAANPAAREEWVDAEVRKIDRDNNKITLKHGEVKHLNMPGMTMVFQLKDPTWLDKLKVGDRIQFTVERGASGFVVTSLRMAGA